MKVVMVTKGRESFEKGIVLSVQHFRIEQFGKASSSDLRGHRD